MKEKKVDYFFPNGLSWTNQAIVNIVYVDWVNVKHVTFLNSIPDKITRYLSPRKCVLNLPGISDRHVLYLN